MRELEIWGERKRMTRWFRFISYLHQGCIVVAGISRGEDADEEQASSGAGCRWFRSSRGAMEFDARSS